MHALNINNDLELARFSQMVDHLGELRAQAKLVGDEIKFLEKELKASQLREINGQYYRATISCSDRARVDWKAVAEKLMPSRQLVVAHTSRQEVCVLRISAHKK